MGERLQELAQFLSCCERGAGLDEHVYWLFDRVVIAYASQSTCSVRILPNDVFITEGYWYYGESAKYLLENG